MKTPLSSLTNALAWFTFSRSHSTIRQHQIQTIPAPTPWWRHQMETFSALLAICAGNSPVPGEFLTQRPVTQSFDVFFDLRPNKRLRLVISEAFVPIMTLLLCHTAIRSVTKIKPPGLHSINTYWFLVSRKFHYRWGIIGLDSIILILLAPGLKYSGWIWSIAWLLIPWLLVSPNLKQPSLKWRHNKRDGVSITGVSIVWSTVCSWADQGKHQNPGPLIFVRGIHRWPGDSPNKGPVTRKCFFFMTSSCGDRSWETITNRAPSKHFQISWSEGLLNNNLWACKFKSS